MSRSTTGNGSKSKLVGNGEFDGRVPDPTRWDFELGNTFFGDRTQPSMAGMPPMLTHLIDLFLQTGRVFKVPTELFGENSWIQVMLGQGLLPEHERFISNCCKGRA